MDHKEKIKIFEAAAVKKGYCFDLDDVGRYKDTFLQEAWEIFAMIELNK